jgi:hypothetical protein
MNLEPADMDVGSDDEKDEGGPSAAVQARKEKREQRKKARKAQQQADKQAKHHELQQQKAEEAARQKQDSLAADRGAVSSLTAIGVGDKVKAMWAKDGQWYEGTVKQIKEDGGYAVALDINQSTIQVASGNVKRPWEA